MVWNYIHTPVYYKTQAEMVTFFKDDSKTFLLKMMNIIILSCYIHRIRCEQNSYAISRLSMEQLSCVL